MTAAAPSLRTVKLHHALLSRIEALMKPNRKYTPDYATLKAYHELAQGEYLTPDGERYVETIIDIMEG